MATETKATSNIKTKYHHGAGLDIHKYYVTACVAVNKEKAVAQLGVQEFKKTPEGLEQMCRFLGKYLLETVVMEATGVYTQVVKDKLDAYAGWGGFKPDVIVIHPALVKKYLGELHQDKVDALDLARLGLIHLAKASFLPKDKLRELRGLTREIRFVDKDCTRIKNRINRILAQWGLVLKDFDIASNWGIDLCAAIISIHGNFGTVLDTILNGQVSVSRLSKAAIQRRATQYKAFSSIELPESAHISLKSYLLELSFNGVIIDRVAAEVKRLIHAEPMLEQQISRVADIPGVSEITAASIIAEIGNVLRFPSRKEFLQYVGCAPTLHQSGEKSSHGHLSKRVNPFAKTLFYIAGKSVCYVVKTESELKEYARKQLNAHWNAKKLAWANTGIKIARIVYAILRNDCIYEAYRGGAYQYPQPGSSQNGAENVKLESKGLMFKTLQAKTRHYIQFVKKFLDNDADTWRDQLRKYFDQLFTDDNSPIDSASDQQEKK